MAFPGSITPTTAGSWSAAPTGRRCARTAWREADTGSLAIGKFADVIVLDRDIYAIRPRDLGGTQVLLTLLGGREVHRDKGFAG